MNFAVVVLFVVVVSFLETCVDATICKPFSKFKVDCDECQCSEDGTEYSCTMRKCGPTSFLDTQDDFTLGGRKKSRIHSRNVKTGISFINDEIPPSREEIQNEYLEDLVYDEINSNKDNFKFDNGKEPIQDVGLEEQDASVIDSEMPESFRKKRYMRLNGKRFIKPHRH